MIRRGRPATAPSDLCRRAWELAHGTEVITWAEVGRILGLSGDAKQKAVYLAARWARHIEQEKTK